MKGGDRKSGRQYRRPTIRPPQEVYQKSQFPVYYLQGFWQAQKKCEQETLIA